MTDMLTACIYSFFSKCSAIKIVKLIKEKKQWHSLCIVSLKEILKIWFSYVCDTESDGV